VKKKAKHRRWEQEFLIVLKIDLPDMSHPTQGDGSAGRKKATKNTMKGTGGFSKLEM